MPKKPFKPVEDCAVHNVRFYKPELNEIFCMAMNKNAKRLALSRSDASIEIWNLHATPFLERRIPSDTKNYSIEDIAWAGDRLFSVGLHALLMEYNIKTLTIKTKTSVTGQSAFCLDVNKNNDCLAVGTEQGYINVFNIREGEIQFTKFLDKQDGRILCLKYDTTGKFIVTGGFDTVRIWNAETGHVVHRMVTGRKIETIETIVWCIAITKDFTIITGDSRGILSFWDGNVGALVESVQSHRADVLSVCLEDEKDIVYCAGVDWNIYTYQKIQKTNDEFKWVKGVSRRLHEHDVRALAVLDGKLYSGGVEGDVCRSYFPPKVYTKYPPILNDAVVVAHQARCILLKYNKYIEVWKLGKADSAGYVLEDPPKQLLKLFRSTKIDSGESKEDRNEGILAATISDDARWIAFSTMNLFRLFKFKYDDCTAELSNIETMSEKVEPCIKAVFTPDCRQLILAAQSGGIQIIALEKVPTLLENIETNEYIKETITTLVCSDHYLIVADIESNIAVWKKWEGNWKFDYKLPKYDFPPTAINLQGDSVLIAYSDVKIVKCSLETQSIVDQVSKFAKHFPLRGLTFLDDTMENMFVHTSQFLFRIRRAAKKKKEEVLIKRRKTNYYEAKEELRRLVKKIDKFKHIVYMNRLNDKEAVLVQIKPEIFVENLPPSQFKEKKFGAK